MRQITRKQRAILDFIQKSQQEEGVTPSYADIAKHFGYSSITTAVDHVRSLQKKGFLDHSFRLARSFKLTAPLQKLRRQVADIPLFGEIPAGLAEEREQQALGCVSIDIGSLGFKPSPNTFALKVQGDSMIGKHIVEGDTVILEHGLSPKPDDVVAALIDNESTLKTYTVEEGQPFLRSENPKYPALYPATELVIQGVMVTLIRSRGR